MSSQTHQPIASTSASAVQNLDASVPTRGATPSLAKNTPSPPSNAPTPMSAAALSPVERENTMFSPSLASLLSAFNTSGNGDRDLLKAILLAKTKEDERLAALDLFRAEQLRAANTLAQQAAYWYSNQSTPASPYSPRSPAHSSPNGLPSSSYYPSRSPPISPPAEALPPPRTAYKRSLSPASSTSSATVVVRGDESAPPAKKAKTTTKHEDAMAALRAKCQRNKAAAAMVPPSRASTLVSSIRSTSASPPLGPTPSRSDAGSLRMLLNAAQGQGVTA